jgi:hypothetical protein
MSADDFHVMPVGDLVEHDTSTACVCHPTTEPVPREDGSIGVLHVHHSFDGREASET